MACRNNNTRRVLRILACCTAGILAYVASFGLALSLAVRVPMWSPTILRPYRALPDVVQVRILMAWSHIDSRVLELVHHYGP